MGFENVESIKKLNRAAHSNYKRRTGGENGSAWKINVLSSCLNDRNRGNRFKLILFSPKIFASTFALSSKNAGLLIS